MPTRDLHDLEEMSDSEFDNAYDYISYRKTIGAIAKLCLR